MASAPNPPRSWFTTVVGAVMSVLTTPQLANLADKLLGLYPRNKPPTGMYAVLDHEVALELEDPRGQSATYRKRQRVRFLQNHIIAFQDKAWGDGNIFAEYKCSPGIPVDFYREGHRYNILISLRETKREGDVEEFHIQRKILSGFMGETEEFQTEIDHQTAQLSMGVTFPRERRPSHCWLIEQHAGITHELGTQALVQLPDGKYEVRWRTSAPKLHEAYILRWQW
jgi:hypothetical protein